MSAPAPHPALTADLDVSGLPPATAWQLLRTNADATTWRAGSYIAKLDTTGRAAVVLPVLTRLGLPVPELCGHRSLPDGRHLTVTRYIDHDPRRTPTRRQWTHIAAALLPLHHDGLAALTGAGVTLERYAVSQPARVAARLDTARTAGGWHAAAADALAAAVERTAPALHGPTHHEAAIHSDLHAGNVLIDAAGQVHLIDWDLLRQGPAEFDLAPLAVDVTAGTQPAGRLTAALAARPDLDADRVGTLARFKQVTAASYYLAESVTQPHLAAEARQRIATLTP